MPYNPNISKPTATTILYSESPFKTPSTPLHEGISSSSTAEKSKQTFVTPIHFCPEKEEQRRVQLYNNLVRAQRRYAEKLSDPYGPSGHYTTEQWKSLGEGLQVEDWEAGFLIENSTRNTADN